MSDYGRKLEFGASVEPLADPPDWAARIAKAADRSGLDLVGIQDHPYQRRFRPASEEAARKLAAKGYTNVRDYEEGKRGWIDAGLPYEGDR